MVTTINSPTRAVEEIARDCPKLGARFIIIGDSKSPADFHQPGADYFDIDRQVGLGLAFAAAAPVKHYARKNVGYLLAMQGGAEVIIETDDDNIPYASFWEPRSPRGRAQLLERTGWTNVYGYFSQAQIWPRGLPLDRVRAELPSFDGVEPSEIYAPIQQGLANDNPDVDAIFRLVLPLPLTFDEATPVALGDGAWCPFNSQNTSWWSEAFPLLYLPSYCSFRMTDIWRSFVAQRIAWANGWSVLFHNATVFQERNEHDLIRDFEEEIPGYLHNKRMAATLEALPLAAGVDAIADNMRACYQAMVKAQWVGEAELPLLEAWLADVAAIAPR